MNAPRRGDAQPVLAGMMTLLLVFGCQSPTARRASTSPRPDPTGSPLARDQAARDEAARGLSPGVLRMGRPQWLSAAPGDVPSEEGAGTPLHFTLDGSYLYGPAKGFVQTPTGGQPGTTSSRRPKLDEIGIDNANIADAEGHALWGHHEVYVGGQWVRLSGDDTLGDELISQGHTFPAGTSVQSDLKLDWYRAGYRYRFEWDDPNDRRPLFTVAPGIGADLLDFSYRLKGGGERADRSYIKGGLQLGVDAAWHITDRWSLVGDVLCSAPISNTPFILKSELLARYRVLSGGGCDVAAELGIAYEQIHYEDNQRVPNHVQVDLGPLLVVGLDFRF